MQCPINSSGKDEKKATFSCSLTLSVDVVYRTYLDAGEHLGVLELREHLAPQVFERDDRVVLHRPRLTQDGAEVQPPL